VGAIFDGKKGKRSKDAPAEGSKSKEPHRNDKRGKKGKKPCREAREQGRDGGHCRGQPSGSPLTTGKSPLKTCRGQP
jgi:hypothetical protein